MNEEYRLQKQRNLESSFLSWVPKKNNGYGKTIDVGVYIKWNLFREHRNKMLDLGKTIHSRTTDVGFTGFANQGLGISKYL